MRLHNEAYNISLLGEFTDKDLEQEFFHDYMVKNIKYIRPSVLAFGIFNVLFTIPDYFYTESNGAFIGIVANRALFLVAILFFYFFFNNIKGYITLARWITAYEIFSGISFLFVFMHYNNPNFLIQSLGVIIIIMVIFLIPNKWIYKLIASIFISVSFLVFSQLGKNSVSLPEYSAGVVYILIVLIMNLVSNYRSNYYNRKQYVFRKELINLSSTDQLTGIYNRAKLDSELKHWLAYTQKHSKPLSLVFFDIDDFKGINDAFGHLVGDEVIVEVAKIVKRMIMDDAIFVRWGGDEFMLLLPTVDKQQALELTERMRISVTQHCFKKVSKVTCSFGLVSANKDDNVSDLLCRADKLLYMSKQKGKNAITVEDELVV